MKKLLQKIDKGTPHKDRLTLVILFAVFAFTVVMNVATFTLHALESI